MSDILQSLASRAMEAEIDRLRAINAELLAALEWYASSDSTEKFFIVDEHGHRLCKFSDMNERARAAIAKAKETT